MTARILMTTAVGLMLLVPLGAAEWSGRGFYEPDTVRDQQSGRMFTNPDVTPGDGVKKVYFSGYAGQSNGVHTAANPNVGTVGTQIMPYPTVVSAFLGVWKDCNEDGYIGLAESIGMAPGYVGIGRDVAGAAAIPAARWDGGYSTLLLSDTSVCAAGSMFNDGTTVREFHPLFPAINPANNAFDLKNDTTRVWADFGYPEDEAKASCPLNPRPEGTYQSTGGALRFADCFTNWRVTGGVSAVADLAGLTLVSFSDAPQGRPDQSGSVLNQRNPYGDPAAAPLVSAYDCSAAPTRLRDPTAPDQDSRGELSAFAVADPTGGELSGPLGDPELVTVTIFSAEDKDFDLVLDSEDDPGTYWVQPTPRTVPQVNPTGSPAGTVNETESGLNDCNTQEERNCGNLIYLGPDQHSGGDVYCIDEARGFEGTSAKRSQTDHYFAPGWGTLVCATASCGNMVWQGTLGYVASRNPYVNRDDLTPWGGVVVSFYAKVHNTDGLTLPNAATATYGSDHCGTSGPITGAFQCDASKWWLNADGTSGWNPNGDWRVRVGTTYQLLDIDCYDAAPAKGVPGVLSIASIGRTCVRPSS